MTIEEQLTEIKIACFGRDEYDIDHALKLAYNLGIQTAADNAIADYNIINPGNQELEDIEVYVIKGSILEHKL